MKSVDRDFDQYEMARRFWPVAYGLMGLGAFALFGRLWDEVHLHGLSFYLFLRIASLLLIYVCPLVLSFGSRRYNRSALKENLVSERVANNNEYFIGFQLKFVYLAFMQLVMWN